MNFRYLIWIVCFYWGHQAFALGKIVSVASSSEQDVFRMEMQFESIVDPNKVGIQFLDKTMVLTLPEAEFKRSIPQVEAKASFIEGVKFSTGKEKALTLEVQFSDVMASQMKENLALEGLGKTLVIEVLPPVWNKGNPPLTTNSVPNANSLAQAPAVVAPPKEEKEIPLFEKKNKPSEDSMGYGKIAFLVFSILGLGGYLIWWMRSKSKMINGPESLMKIKVVTQFHLGPKKSLAVIRVAGESLLLGITDSNIGLIKSLSLLDEDLPEVAPVDFSETLVQQDYKVTKHESKTGQKNDDLESSIDEEFSFGPAVKTTLTQKIPMLRRMI